MAMESLTLGAFTLRFIMRMVAKSGHTFSDGTSVAGYAASVAPSYFDDDRYRLLGPEECADSDMSYWEEDGDYDAR